MDLGFISEDMDLHRRQDWTNSDVKTWRLRGAGLFDRITVHHTAGQINRHTLEPDVINDLDSVLASHSSRGYGDIGYHFVVDYAGRVWEGRSLAYEGAHVSDQNENNIGIMLLGNFQEQDPSCDQLDSMYKLVRVLRDHYRIKKHRIYGHRDLGHSICPGDNLYTHVVSLKT